MRTNVTFRHPAKFVPVSEDDGVLAASGAQWFAVLLRRIPGLQVDESPCQEDWGVVFFAGRNRKTFWIGLSAWDSDGAWVAHFHHGSIAWWQRLSLSGKAELKSLLADAHQALSSEPAISDINWHYERDMSEPLPVGFANPVDAV